MNNESIIAKRIFSLCDLTSLNDSDTDEVITALCARAVSPFGNVAAVCVYPRFVKLAKQLLKNTNVKIATVSNFPGGDNDSQAVYAEVKQSIEDGADEIDLVVPYKKFMQGDRSSVIQLTKEIKQICKNSNVLLKTILETGMLESKEQIENISNDALVGGSDFLKTSTGKVPVNATLEAAEIMIRCIKQSGNNVGFKAAGGIRTMDDAKNYLKIATEIMGDEWITPETFRFGASALLDDLANAL